MYPEDKLLLLSASSHYEMKRARKRAPEVLGSVEWSPEDYRLASIS